MSSPRVSVIVATCGRPEVLARTLACLAASGQSVAADVFEVIVADDSRDDATRVMVAERFPEAIYVRGLGRGPATNRNGGAAAARGEWLAFIDDDCRPEQGWLQALLRAAQEPELQVIEGRIFVPDKSDGAFTRHVENLTGGNFWSGNLTIRRSIFARLGRFDEDFLEAGGEDLEFAERIRRAGVRTVFCPEATVIHPTHVVSWRYLLWRTFMMRWHLLYLLKTGQGLPLDAPLWRAVGSVILTRSVGQLRSSWHTLRRSTRAPQWIAFDLASSWLMFPVLLPYLAYWELRFRRELRTRSAQAV